MVVVHFEKLSKAVDFYNENRIEVEQVEFCDIVPSISNPLDSEEVLKLIVDLYEEANSHI